MEIASRRNCRGNRCHPTFDKTHDGDGAPPSISAQDLRPRIEEYEIVQQHAAMGAEILSGIEGGAPSARIVRHHHENWDGTGYPDGLRREAIPRGPRSWPSPTCYDARSRRRPYPPAA